MSAKFWSNVDIDIQTALGAAQTVTGITKADPGVVTHSGVDPTNADILLLNIAGMTELHTRAFAASAVNGAANTFELGEDTTDYHNFTSGSFKVVTLGAGMTNVQDVDASGGEPEFADTTTVHDQIRRRTPTVVSPFSMKFGCLFEPGDAAMKELGKASRSLTTRVIKVTFADGSYMVGNAYVSAPGVPTGQAQDVVKTLVTLEFQGLPTVYEA
jgi:hypothetical protein